MGALQALSLEHDATMGSGLCLRKSNRGPRIKNACIDTNTNKRFKFGDKVCSPQLLMQVRVWCNKLYGERKPRLRFEE